MKLTSVECIGRSQLISSVIPTARKASDDGLGDGGGGKRVKHLLITREDGTCGCPSHLLPAVVLHPVPCCRSCAACGKAIPLGTAEHACLAIERPPAAPDRR